MCQFSSFFSWSARFSPVIVSMPFSTLMSTSSARTPGSSASTITCSSFSRTLIAGAQITFSPEVRGQLTASNSSCISRRRLNVSGTELQPLVRRTVGNMVPPGPNEYDVARGVCAAAQQIEIAALLVPGDFANQASAPATGAAATRGRRAVLTGGSRMVRYRPMLPLFALVFAAACAPGDDAAETDTAARTAEAAPPQEAPVAVRDTPEDSVIFEQTIAWVRESRADTLPIGELTAAIAQRFVGAPYTPGLLEVPQTEQLVVNLREFDCVTYVEQMLAIARAVAADEPTYARFRDELRRIRYRAGQLAGYPSRLHYFSEWISDNDAKGVVTNITQQLGGVRDSTGIDFMSQHIPSYRQLADSVNLVAIREKEAELSSFPRYAI